MSYPYPIKDWRDESQYPKKLTRAQWLWEFTRRNAEFQRHWDIFKTLPDSSPEVGIKNGKWKGGPDRNKPLSEYIGFVDPPALDGEALDEYTERNREVEWHVEPYQDFFYRKFATRPCDPKEDDYTNIVHIHGLIEESCPLPFEDFHDDLGSNFHKHTAMVPDYVARPVSLMFDLSKDLGPQFAKAKRILNDRQKFAIEVGAVETVGGNSGLHEKKLHRRLRVLDGYAALRMEGRSETDIWNSVGFDIFYYLSPERSPKNSEQKRWSEAAKDDFLAAESIRVLLAKGD